MGNAGHAVVGQHPTKYAPKGHLAAQSVEIQRLDDVLWPLRLRGESAPSITLLKVDVEGFECQVVHGMSSLLRARAISSIKVEIFDALLRLQGCSATELQGLLHAAGFQLYLIPHGSEAVGTPTTQPMAPTAVVSTSEPYNLWCMLSPTPPPPRMLDAAMPSPPPVTDEQDRAAPSDSGFGWRSRRRSAARKTRMFRRLATQDATPGKLHRRHHP